MAEEVEYILPMDKKPAIFDLDLKFLVGMYIFNILHKYGGAIQCTHCTHKTAHLYFNLDFTGSQCNLIREGVI